MQKLIAANWKMFKNSLEATETIQEFKNIIKKVPKKRDVVFFPSFIALEASVKAIDSFGNIFCGAQDVFPSKEGPYTGEISPEMILNTGASWVLVGHSERRHLLSEKEEFIAKKTIFSLFSGLNTILCVGETLHNRESGKLYDELNRQVSSALKGLPTPFDPRTLVVAYEPVWAIGTGKTAQNVDIIEAHTIIRDSLKDILGNGAAQIRILYGGSVKPENAGEILKLDNVDGLLVGGASLQAESFSKIVSA